MPRLAVTVITLNEAQDLPDCLRSVSFADDVLVVDSGSTDRTVEIARQMGARVIENPWPGYAAQRQFALDRAQGDWCLVLDADERVSPELQSEIAVAITRENTDGYYIPFETRMFDKTLRHGGARGERNLRLMRKSKTRWAQSGSQDRAVVDGELGSLTAPIVHTPYESLTEYFDKLNTKTSQRALELHQNGERFSKRRTLRRLLGFFHRYLLRLGCLDGWVGFLHASLNALFDFVTQAKLFVITNYNPEASIIITTHLIADIEPVLDDFAFMTYGGDIVRMGNADTVREATGKTLDELFREEFRC